LLTLLAPSLLTLLAPSSQFYRGRAFDATRRITTFEVDFLDMNLDFTDMLGFPANRDVGSPATTSFFWEAGQLA
jgi:hypothetical protein